LHVQRLSNDLENVQGTTPNTGHKYKQQHLSNWQQNANKVNITERSQIASVSSPYKTCFKNKKKVTTAQIFSNFNNL